MPDYEKCSELVSEFLRIAKIALLPQVVSNNVCKYYKCFKKICKALTEMTTTSGSHGNSLSSSMRLASLYNFLD